MTAELDPTPEIRRILIVDDHPMLLDGVREYLERFLPNTQVVTLPALPEILPTAERYDLVLLDLHLQPGDQRTAVDALAAAVTRLAPTPVAAFSGDVSPERARQCLDAGDAGFVPKTLKGSTFTAAIELLLSGERFVPAVLLSEPAPPTPIALGAKALEGLTARERQILEQLSQGLSNKEIAYQIHLTEGTVKQYINTLFRKLEVKSRTQAVRRYLEATKV